MLNLDCPPVYMYSSFRKFLPDEKHITRVCSEDVLVMVYDGVLRFHENGSLIEVEKGEYYLQRRGLLQEGRIPSSLPQYYYIHLMGDYSPSAHMLPLRGKANFQELMPLFTQLDQLLLSKGSVMEQSQVFYQILSVLNRQFTLSEARRTVQQAIGFIFQDLNQPFSLDELTRICGYSKNYLIRLFRQETGCTPHEYVSRLKLDLARRLLLNSDLPVGSIALECGFGSYINFYKEFCKAEGTSPLKWRNSQRHALPQDTLYATIIQEKDLKGELLHEHIGSQRQSQG